jgi:hypothetical protein
MSALALERAARERVMPPNKPPKFRVSREPDGIIKIEMFGGDTSEEADREFVEFIRDKAECGDTIVISHAGRNVVRVFKVH